MDLKCGMPTSSLGMCSREARYEYIRDNAGTTERPDVIVLAVCAQHYRAKGHARMLRPALWEYDRVYDRAAGFNVYRRPQ